MFFCAKQIRSGDMKKFSLNGFEMSSKLTFGLICIMAAVMHLTFFLLFLKFKLFLLMYVNIGSVCLYITGGIISIFKDIARHSLACIIVIFSEVILHASLCTLIVGVDTCFILYPIVSLPICVYYLFFYCERRVFRRAVIIFVASTLLVTAATVGVAEFFGGSLPTNIAVLSRKEKMIARCVNIFFAAVMLYWFTTMFYLEMTRLIDKVRISTDKLQYTATHDALTGLTNRRSFWEFFDVLCRDSKHYNIAMGDLDSFKKINDTYGHGCGDLVLKSVADIIADNTNDNEIACRWGGEEMVVVFIGEREEALTRLEKIRSQIESLSLDYEGLNVRVTMTFGFADSEELKLALSESDIDKLDDTDVIFKHSGVESLISIVDKRLYTGKDNGKNVVVDK